eukprot:TRINITY_DN49383_c0_g1_i1.p1 TRINITY_DN49383_c0_g1~~TRINITY_DN49383_c0_g1_i1.p1  ORF type:complete len:347 (+),score=41.19 TRINITY_DN49383_c0_g1_i1:64-1104(+)
MMDAPALIANLHGQMLRMLCNEMRIHFVGLRSAAAHARRRGLLSNQTVKRLGRLDDAFAVTRHISAPYAKEFVDCVMTELKPGASSAETFDVDSCVSTRSSPSDSFESSGERVPPFTPAPCFDVGSDDLEEYQQSYFPSTCAHKDEVTQTDNHMPGFTYVVLETLNAHNDCRNKVEELLRAIPVLPPRGPALALGSTPVVRDIDCAHICRHALLALARFDDAAYDFIADEHNANASARQLDMKYIAYLIGCHQSVDPFMKQNGYAIRDISKLMSFYSKIGKLIKKTTAVPYIQYISVYSFGEEQFDDEGIFTCSLDQFWTSCIDEDLYDDIQDWAASVTSTSASPS